MIVIFYRFNNESVSIYIDYILENNRLSFFYQTFSVGLSFPADGVSGAISENTVDET